MYKARTILNDTEVYLSNVFHSIQKDGTEISILKQNSTPPVSKICSVLSNEYFNRYQKLLSIEDLMIDCNNKKFR